MFIVIENFEEELNKKFKSDSNKILGGLTTITKIDETDIQLHSNKKKNLLPQELCKNKYFINELNKNMNIIDINEINNNINNININPAELTKKYAYQPKDVVDILYDPVKNKPILKVKWNEINIANDMEKETEEDYNEFKNRFPMMLINFLEKKVKVVQQKCGNGNEQNTTCDKLLSEIAN